MIIILSCKFCNLDNSKMFNTILEETNNFIVIPSLGSFVEGYILIVSKRHYNNMAQLNIEEKKEYLYLINKYRNLFNKIYNKYPIIFEHGDIDNNTKTSSIKHAHTHIVNYIFKDELKVINKLNLESLDTINDIKNNVNYIMYINQYNKIFITYKYRFISQLMRIIIADDLNIKGKYSWKKNRFNNNIKLTIDKIKDNI